MQLNVFSLSVLMICSFLLKGFLASCLFSEDGKKLSDFSGFDISSWVFSGCNEVAVMSAFPYNIPCIHRISWSCALYWGECFLELCTYSGVDGQWHSSEELQFRWYYFRGGLQVCVQNSISNLLKREVTVQAWIAQRAWKILSNSDSTFKMYFKTDYYCV